MGLPRRKGDLFELIQILLVVPSLLGRYKGVPVCKCLWRSEYNDRQGLWVLVVKVGEGHWTESKRKN